MWCSSVVSLALLLVFSRPCCFVKISVNYGVQKPGRFRVEIAFFGNKLKCRGREWGGCFRQWYPGGRYPEGKEKECGEDEIEDKADKADNSTVSAPAPNSMYEGCIKGVRLSTSLRHLYQCGHCFAMPTGAAQIGHVPPGGTLVKIAILVKSWKSRLVEIGEN